MIRVERVVCTSFTLLFSAVSSFAQHNLGLATSDYSALNSLYVNPANIAGCKEKIAVSLFSLNLGVDNNLGTFTNLSDVGNSNTSAFNFSGNNTFSAILPAVDLHLPGILVGLNDALQQSFALTLRVRGFNQFNNFSQDLYSTVKGTDRSNQNISYQTTDFNWTAHVWSEVGLSYGLVPYEDDNNQIKAGITLRYLGGIDYLSLKGKNLNIDYQANNDTFRAYNSDLEFASNAISADNAYANGLNASSVLNQFFGSKEGGGFGMDLGVVYTTYFGGKDKEDPASHRFRASAAITDIGAITYKQQNNFVVNVAGSGYLTGKGLSDNLKDYTDLKNYAAQQGYSVDTGSRATKVHMPTALNAGADFQVYQKLFVNAIFIANLANRQNYGNSYYSQFSLTPRYDSKLLTVGLPITYSSLAGDIKLGLGFRVGGFFFGSDDMLALMSSSQHGFDFYFGGYVPIYKKKPQEYYNPK